MPRQTRRTAWASPPTPPPSTKSPRPWARRLRLWRGSIPPRYRRSTKRSTTIRTPSTTRSRRTRRWRSCACCARSAAAPTPTRAARWTSALRCGFTPPTDRLHRRRQDARRARSRRGAGRAWRSTPNRPASSIASPRSRRAQGAGARVALRVNPDIDAKSHPHISTGLKTNKFGVPIDEAPAIYPRDRRAAPALQPVGVHVHIGSQITTLDPLRARRRGARGARARAARRRHRARAPRHRRRPRHRLRRQRRADPPREYAAARAAGAAAPGCRSCSSPAASSSAPPACCCRASSTSSSFPAAQRFVVLDAGMTELMRPALYGAYPPHRAGARRARPTKRLGHRRPDLREHRRLRRAIASCRRSRSATSSPCSTPAPTAR